MTELLVVITIIGLLSSIATVSFTSSRMKARDARRLGDLDTVRNGLELYVDDHGGYPSDNASGDNGLILGGVGATKLNELGWTDAVSETPIIDRISGNPKGGGADYIYYSLNRDGSHCASSPCENFRIEYFLETPLAGLQAGPRMLGPVSNDPASPEASARILARTAPSAADTVTTKLMPVVGPTVAALDTARKATIDNPLVEKTADVVGPAATVVTGVATASGVVSAASSVGTVASAFSSVSTASGAVSIASSAETAAVAAGATASAATAAGQVGALFYLIFTQPLLLLRKRKEYAWGVVYDSQKKLPIDLAIVRLVDAVTGRVAQTRVTDHAGRLFFFAAKGTYRLEVVKPGYVFPSRALIGEKEDGKFANLYFGQKFTVPESGQVINPTVPLDPAGADLDDKEFIRRFVRHNLQNAVSMIGFFLNLIAFTIKPSYLLAGLLVANVALFYLFRRLASPKQPAEWGEVRDEKTGKPVVHAVVRLFSSPYNKLVDTKVSDRRGRYNFLVGQNVYFLTATSNGYWKTESFPVDLRVSDHPQVISSVVKMRPQTEGASIDPFAKQ